MPPAAAEVEDPVKEIAETRLGHKLTAACADDLAVAGAASAFARAGKGVLAS